MTYIDYGIFAVYFIAMIGVGYYFFRRNKSTDDYYVGGRQMGSLHIGLSVVATDVGGGFSIGLGGLGFIMGIAGSWMLFTGLLGAWLAAVFLIPRITSFSSKLRLLTFPQIFNVYYSGKVALLAGIISAIGYIGFTSSQLLAGAKLASATFIDLDLNTALLIMGIIAVGYTVIGGLKAVIYTDTVQWIILMVGLIFVGIPVAYVGIGGMDAIKTHVDPSLLSLSNISWVTFVNWLVTIVPIWFVGMTLYQRIYACKDAKTAQRAWYIAGLFEYPVMAFMGVLLGLFARVAAEQGMFEYAGYLSAADMDEEMGLPMLLRTILPTGFMGLMLAAYFSAIMSTADSCLMAASGNLQTDVFGRFFPPIGESSNLLRASQIITLVIGVLALLLATLMQNVLELMLLSYAFMVSGLFIPVIGAIFNWRRNAEAAFYSMLLGGVTTTILILSKYDLPLGLDANIGGISISAITFVVLSRVLNSDDNLQKTNT
ncbi:MAG: sodium:solute symporter family protein [Saprospiraceae bacterium]|nr:sodium:solute symporter family protein [Saprospiraceae bacterium]